MKLFLTILCLVLLSSYFYSEEISSDKIVMRGGIVYEINSTIPFSGTVLVFRDDGQLKNRENYRDGVRDGLLENFHENGQLSGKGYMKKGKPEGLMETFYKNGRLHSRSNHKEGVPVGVILHD